MENNRREAAEFLKNSRQLCNSRAFWIEIIFFNYCSMFRNWGAGAPPPLHSLMTKNFKQNLPVCSKTSIFSNLFEDIKTFSDTSRMQLFESIIQSFNGWHVIASWFWWTICKRLFWRISIQIKRLKQSRNRTLFTLRSIPGGPRKMHIYIYVPSCPPPSKRYNQEESAGSGKGNSRNNIKPTKNTLLEP